MVKGLINKMVYIVMAIMVLIPMLALIYAICEDPTWDKCK